MTRKFYWMKFKEDFFEDSVIKRIRKLPNGAEMVLILQKLYLKSLATEGIFKNVSLMPSLAEDVALIIDEDVQIVRMALGIFEKVGLVEMWDEETLYFNSLQPLIGKEGDSAERVRKHREKKQLEEAEKAKAREKALQCNNEVTEVTLLPLQCNNEVTKCNTEIEIEKEIEKKKKDIVGKANASTNDFISVWSKYPRKDGKADAMKKVPKLIKEYGLEQMIRATERYAERVKGTERQFIQTGSRFYNGSYMDYLDDVVEENKEPQVQLEDESKYNGKKDWA